MLLISVEIISSKLKKDSGVSESEQIWRRHKIYMPELVDVQVANTNRIGKAWM